MYHTRTAVIGCGMIGQSHCETLGELGVPVVATADPVLDRARAVAALVGAQAFTDYRDLLNRVEVDLVFICTPTPAHYEVVLEAARYQRHIFCEKPLAETLSQGREMCQAASEAGVVMGFGFKMRFEAVFARAMALIQSKAIGRPLYSIFSYFQQLPPPERAWYCDYGALRDMIPHAIDLSNWLLGLQPTWVTARLDSLLGLKGEDKVFLQIAYNDTAIASIHGGWGGKHYPHVARSGDILFQIVGDEGYVAGSRWGQLVSATREGTTHEELAPVDAFAVESESFLRALEAGARPPVGAEDGLVAQAVIEAAYTSAKTRQPVEVDPWG